MIGFAALTLRSAQDVAQTLFRLQGVLSQLPTSDTTDELSDHLAAAMAAALRLQSEAALEATPSGPANSQKR